MPLIRSFRALVLGVAQAMFCAPAQAEGETIPPDVMVPYVFNVQLPACTKDGRTIPTRGDYRMENLLLALERRQMMPAHEGIAFQQILDIFKGLAWFIEQGDGAYITEERLAERVGCSTREIRRVLTWAKGVGWLPYWNRFRDSDRLKTDDGRPATAARNNAYLLLALPRELAAQLAEEDLLDLIALGKKKPVIHELTRAEPGSERSPAAPPSPPHPAPAVDLDFNTFVQVFGEERERHYGNVDHGKVRAENRATIASYVSDLVGEACAWASGRDLKLERAAVRTDLCQRIVRAWLALPGAKDILFERQHPIGLIVGDLGKLVPEALKAWRTAQAKPRALAPLPAAVAAAPGDSEPARLPPAPAIPKLQPAPPPPAILALAAKDPPGHDPMAPPPRRARAPDG